MGKVHHVEHAEDQGEAGSDEHEDAAECQPGKDLQCDESEKNIGHGDLPKIRGGSSFVSQFRAGAELALVGFCNCDDFKRILRALHLRLCL